MDRLSAFYLNARNKKGKSENIRPINLIRFKKEIIETNMETDSLLNENWTVSLNDVNP